MAGYRNQFTLLWRSASAIVLLTTTVHAAPNYEEMLVPPKAKNLSVRSSVGTFEIYFEIERNYPELGLAANWKDKLKELGWYTCVGNPESQGVFSWTQYVDETKRPKMIVKRIIGILSNGTSVATIISKYESPFNIEAARQLNTLPTNDLQKVSIKISDGEAAIEDVSKIFRVTCNKR